MTAPEYYHYATAKEDGGYVFAFRYRYDPDTEFPPKEYNNLVADAYSSDGKFIAQCENVLPFATGAVEGNKDEIRFVCRTDDEKYEERIYSVSKAEFISTKQVEIGDYVYA